MAQTGSLLSPSALRERLLYDGGSNSATVAAGAGGAGQVFTGIGRVCRITITTLGTAATLLYDNTSAAGNVLFTIPASPTVGTVYNVQLPTAVGLFAGGATNTSAFTVSYDLTGTAAVNPASLNEELQSIGGANNAFVAAGAGGAGQVKTGAGRLCRITVNTVGTAATSFYDNTSAAAPIIYTLKASPALGDLYDVQIPFSTGLYAGGAVNTSGVTLGYD